MRVLIVGAGDLGQRLSALLKAQSLQVCTARRTAGMADYALDVSQSLRDAQLNFAEFSHIVFCATPDGRSEDSYHTLYVEGIKNLLAVRTQARIVFCSSTAVYPQNDGSWVDESTPCQPTAFNGAKLLQAEAQLDLQSDLVLRLGGIYGPGRNHARTQATNGITGAIQWTNRIHINDAASVTAQLIQRHHAGVFNVVDDQPILQRDLYDFLRHQPITTLDPQQLVDTQGKRVSNRKLRAVGIGLQHPSFREGYAAQ